MNKLVPIFNKINLPVFKVIKDELHAYENCSSIIPNYNILRGEILDTGGWRALYLESFHRETHFARALFPKTMALLDTIPGGVSAFFSVIAPNTQLEWHTGEV